MMQNKKIFMMGDSIFVRYLPYLNEILSSKYEVFTKSGEYEALQNLDVPKGMNTGDSRTVLNFLKEENAQKRISYRYCLFNCGAHDIKRDAKTKELQVDTGEFKTNLEQIIGIFKSNQVKPVFVTTVPIYDNIHNRIIGKEYLRYNEDSTEYNRIAKEMMKKNNVPVIDLNYFTKIYGEEAICDHIHMKPEISKYQAIFIAGALLSVFNAYEEDD